jgi:Spy/CpxP family protein refolding chaperone
MMSRALAVCAFFLFAAGAAWAEPPKEPPAFMRSLYPPELVMRHQRDIDLADEQREAITAAIAETQAAVVEIGWQARDIERRIEAHFAASPIDEGAALEEVGHLLDLEEQVKTTHLRLLIRIRNQLRAEQRERLDSLRGDS